MESTGLQHQIWVKLSSARNTGLTVDELVELCDETNQYQEPRKAIAQNLRALDAKGSAQRFDDRWYATGYNPDIHNDHPHPSLNVESHSREVAVPPYMENWEGETLTLCVDPPRFDHALRIYVEYRNGTGHYVPLPKKPVITVTNGIPEGLSPAAVCYSEVTKLLITHRKDGRCIEETRNILEGYKVFIGPA